MDFYQFRERWGWAMQAFFIILFIVLLIVLYKYAKELSQHPLFYVGNKYNLTFCTDAEGFTYTFGEVVTRSKGTRVEPVLELPNFTNIS